MNTISNQDVEIHRPVTIEEAITNFIKAIREDAAIQQARVEKLNARLEKLGGTK